MNINNIKKLRDHIAALNEGEFDISSVNKCFIGHTKKVFGQFCGKLDLEEISELYMPNDWNTRKDITISLAVSVLDNLINTGKVDWDFAINNPAKLEEIK